MNKLILKSKRLGKNINKYCEKIYCYIIVFCSLCVLGVISFYNAIMTSYLVKWEVTYYVKDSIVLNILSVIFFILFLFLIKISQLYQYLQNIVADDVKYKKLKNTIFFLIFLIGSVWALCTQFIPGVDEGELQEMLFAFSKKDYYMFAPGGYLDRYHNNIGLFLYEYCITLLFGTKNYLIFELINSYAIALMYKQLSEIGGELGLGRLGQLSISLVGIIFVPVTLYSIMVYGNIVGITLSTIAIKYELQFFKELEIKKALLCVVYITAGICLKSTVLIYFIAIFIFALFKLITMRKKQIALLLIIILLGFKIQATIPIFIVEKITGYELDNPISSWVWIAMGLQESELAPGWWNGYLHSSYEEAKGDVLLQEKLAKKSIKNSVTKFKNNPDYAFEFFSKKISSTWANPSFQAFATIRNGTNIEIPKWVKAVLSYQGQYVIVKFLNITEFCILIGALIELIIGYNKKEYINSLILPMILIGGFFFLIIWETKSRYALLFFVTLIPTAVMGYNKLIEKLYFLYILNRNLSKKKKDIFNVFKRIYFPIIVILFVFTFCGFAYKSNRKNILIENTEEYYEYLDTQRLQSIKDLDKYLKLLAKNKNYSIFFAVKDIQGYCLTAKNILNMQNLGFEHMNLLLEHDYHTFVGVLYNGKVIHQYIGENEQYRYTDVLEDNHIILESGTLDFGDIASININGREYAINSRGLNIVVMNNKLQRVIDSVAFDTHSVDIPCIRN